MDLKGTQLKDTFGNLITIGTTAGTPSTGQIENGNGEDITDLTVNGTVNATTFNGAVTGNVSGDLTGNVTSSSVLADGVTATTQTSNDNSTKVATTAYVDAQVTGAGDLDVSDGSTSSSVDLNSQVLTVQGTNNQIDVSLSGQAFTVASAYNQQNPNIRVNMFTPTGLTNSTNNYVGFSGYLMGPNNASTTFELVNSGQATSTGARIHVKESGQYLFNVYAKLSGLGNGTEVLINITESTSSTGAMSSAKGIVQHTYSHPSMTAIATGTIFLYNNNNNNYYSFYINPSANTPTLEFAELQIIRLSAV